MTRHTIISPETVEETRLLYEAAVVPVRDCMDNIGLKRDAFYALAHTLGWKLRRPPATRRGDVGDVGNASDANETKPAAAEAPEMPPARVAPMMPDELIPKIEAAINREFAHAEHALAHGEPRNAEKTARTMASLVRSLAELKRVQRDAQGHGTQNDAAGEAPARDLAELKAELARRLDRLRRSRAG
ncbi:MAG: hypothetical protein QOG66_1685 [Methylobacteriaceae bacterium]|nr:hypothetical protein [Methylobacteriaceae bacterium]